MSSSCIFKTRYWKWFLFLGFRFLFDSFYLLSRNFVSIWYFFNTYGWWAFSVIFYLHNLFNFKFQLKFGTNFLKEIFRKILRTTSETLLVLQRNTFCLLPRFFHLCLAWFVQHAISLKIKENSLNLLKPSFMHPL